MIKNILLVGVGGGLGSMLRYICYLALKNQSFPYATLLVNIVGSFIIGIILASSLRSGGHWDATKLFLATGICGGFTTFSAFSYENISLIQSGKYSTAFLYMLISIAGGLLACWFGLRLAQN